MKKPERMKKIVLVIVIFFLLLCPLFAQKWLTHQYSEVNGPVSSFVNDIVQDHWGRIWMATRSGISCYDGVTWQHYTEFEGLESPSFDRLEIDHQGRIWALAETPLPGIAQIYVCDSESWEQHAPLRIDNKVKNEISGFKLLGVGDKTIALVSTLESGLYWSVDTGTEWHNISSADGLAADRINSMAILKEKCYLATGDGISLLNAGLTLTIDKQFRLAAGFPVKNIESIAVEDKDKYSDSILSSSRLWIYGAGYLGYFDEGSEKIEYFDTGIRFSRIGKEIHLQPDYRTGVYLGNVLDIFYVNTKSRVTQRLSVSNGLVSLGVNAMLCDFEKIIWICCDRGVTKISSRRFSSFQEVHGLLEDEVTAVLEYKPGQFALGHNSGITLYDGKTFQKIPFEKGGQLAPSVGRVLDMKLDSLGNIWAAAATLGLVKITSNGKTEWFGRDRGLLGEVVSLWIDSDDNKWICTNEAIYHLDKKGAITDRSKEFPTTLVRKIFGSEKKDRLVYLATYASGLYAFENNRWRNYRLEENSKGASSVSQYHKNNSIYAVKEDSRGRLFVGTAGGIFSRESGNLRRFTVKGFSLERPVYFIVEDNLHRLWFGTDNGVVLWDWNKNRQIVYSVPDGLIGQETNRAAGIVDSNGRLWFGTNRGVSIYDRVYDNLDNWNPPPKVQLLYLEAYRGRMPLDKPIQLSYNDRRLLFKFRGISFHDEKGIRFQHKLEGFDDTQWVEGNYPYRQVIEYTSLPPGRYRLHLKARNSIGVWSDVVSSEEIIILRPFYQTWWFFVFVLLAGALVFYAIFRLLSARRNAARLEQLVNERSSQLVASEKKYRELFEDSQDMVFIMSLAALGGNSKLLDINPAGVALLGYGSKAEAMSINVESDFFLNPVETKAFTDEIQRKGSVKEYELEIKRKEGEKLTVMLTASLVPGRKNAPGILRGIVRDITDKKRMQQQLEQSQKMEAIGTLAGGIAHDFNNILGMIKGYLELCLNETSVTEGSKLKKNIDRAILSSDRAKELVKQILTFSRQRKDERKPLKISLILKETLKLLRSSLPSTIQFCTELKSEAIVMADPTQVHQVLMNLCTNAAYAMEETGGVLGVKLTDVELDEAAAMEYNDLKPGHYVRLTVSDTGKGIEPSIIKRIFEPYFTTKEMGEGTGMGLAVIHGIVKSYSGDITVSSRLNEGAVFNVLLPAEEVAEPAPEAMPKAEIHRGQDEKVLLVDDEPLLVDVGRMALEMLGYRVTDATGSEDALRAFSEEPGKFDLVITDLTMPKMTGMQLAGELKKIRADIPIILCTGFSEKVSREQLDSLGIRELLLKPLDKRSLAAAIRRVLHGES